MQKSLAKESVGYLMQEVGIANVIGVMSEILDEQSEKLLINGESSSNEFKNLCFLAEVLDLASQCTDLDIRTWSYEDRKELKEYLQHQAINLYVS